MKRALAWLALLGLATGLAVTSRVPEAGALWRSGFVALALLGVPLVWWAARALRPSPLVLIAVALAMRLCLLPVPPTLSDDGFRYLWDGALSADGRSPYALTPREAVAAGFEPPVALILLNSPDYHSVYPPVSQLAFALAFALGGSFGVAWIVFKVLLVAVELGGLTVLARRVEPGLLALYAWHPVAVAEIAGQGHTEGFVVGCLSLALAAFGGGREGRGGAALALAGWVKLWPLALFALARRSWRALVMGAVVAVGVALPFVAGGDWGGVGRSLGLYGGTFDFYSAHYLALKAALWPIAGESASRWASVGLGAVGLVGLSVIAIKNQNLTPAALAGAVCALTLTSATLHPWHLVPALWAATLFPSRWRRPVLWLVSVAPLTYLGYVGIVESHSLALVVGWGGALGWVAWAWWGASWVRHALVRRGNAKWSRIERLVAPERGRRILDLGCAEGFVGEAADRAGHHVTLADVVDVREVALGFVRASERAVPLPDRAFDGVVLVFVLHHAEVAEAVLQEASRMSRSWIAVWETVPEAWMCQPLLQTTDSFVNGLRHDTDMRSAQLRSVPEWEALFESLNLRVVARERWGVFHPQALWILERREHVPER